LRAAELIDAVGLGGRERALPTTLDRASRLRL
jgi:hypothetical protein